MRREILAALRARGCGLTLEELASEIGADCPARKLKKLLKELAADAKVLRVAGGDRRPRYWLGNAS